MRTFDKYFSIEIRNLNTQVWLKVYDPVNVSLRDIMGEIKEQKITFGINKLLLKQLTESQFPIGEYLIAEGSSPTRGEDSKAECMVQITPAPLKVDIKNENNQYCPITITNVRKGQRLFRFLKSTPGVPGYNVFGEELPPIKGKDLPLLRGRNTAYSDDEKNYLIAAKDGNFTYEDSQAAVEPDYNVNGDISTLNGSVIEFYGNLTVQGDIRLGTTLKVDGNLTVMGAVEDAVIECGGDVDIRTGLRGSGRGKIVANGNVSFLHGYNYTIISRSSIKIGKIAMNCNLTAKSIDSSRGVICGGSTLAFTKIDILDLGKERYSRTTVTLGGKLNHMVLFGERDGEILNLSKKVHLCTTKLEHLKRVTANRTLTREQEEGIFSVQFAFDQLNDLLDKRREERSNLQSELRGIAHKLIVHGTLYESVHLVINDVDVPIVESVKNTVFTEKDFKITSGKNL